jgi:hypothetical protein
MAREYSDHFDRFGHTLVCKFHASRIIAGFFCLCESGASLILIKVCVVHPAHIVSCNTARNFRSANSPGPSVIGLTFQGFQPTCIDLHVMKHQWISK